MWRLEWPLQLGAPAANVPAPGPSLISLPVRQCSIYIEHARNSLSSTISFAIDQTPTFPRMRSPNAVVIGRQDQEASPGKGLFPGQTGEANRFQQELPLGARKSRYTQAVGRKADANR